mgnify:FL=1
MATIRIPGRTGNAAKLLRQVRLTDRQRITLEALVEGRPTGLGERDRAAVLAQIVTACACAGAEAALLDVLGLDLISVSLALRLCMHSATRPGGRDVGEVADYATRHAATRTALELRRRIGPRASRKEEPVPRDRGDLHRAGERDRVASIATLAPAPAVTAGSE